MVTPVLPARTGFQRRKVPSLGELATNKCIQNLSRLQDVGLTPFHLLRPILSRMNAKQLAQIEASSPQLVPHTDAIWPGLIERDFPDRPIYAKESLSKRIATRPGASASPGARSGPGAGRAATTARSTLVDENMPNKALYYQYSDDRESFRQDSAQRLRRITERLKQEKQAKTIVSVPILREPSTRRQQRASSALWSYSLPRSNTIVGKARHDVKKRTLMFPPRATRAHDPYSVFAGPAVRQQPPAALTPRRTRPPTSFNTIETRGSSGVCFALSPTTLGAVIVAPPLVPPAPSGPRTSGTCSRTAAARAGAPSRTASIRQGVASPADTSSTTAANPLAPIPADTNSSGDRAEPGPLILPPRKRRPASIFLSRKRPSVRTGLTTLAAPALPVGPAPPPSTKRPPATQRPPTTQRPTASALEKPAGPCTIRRIKSSIFQ